MITTAAASTITISFLSGVFKKKLVKLSLIMLCAKLAAQSYHLIYSNKFQMRRTVKKYIENLVSSVFTFRTITSGDKDVYLDQIYYPLQVSSYKFKNIKIDDHENLENEKKEYA